MEYVLYIDRIWLLYFSLHVFLYGLTGKQLHRKVSISRILMVSACNGVTFLVLLFIPGVTVPLKMLIQVGILDLLFCQLVFSFLTKEMLIYGYIIFCGYGMLFGGVLLAWQNVNGNDKRCISTFQIIGILGLLTGCIVLLYFYRKFRDPAENNKYQVELDFYGVQRKCIGLYDSGNGLYEPFQHRPVIIIDENAFSDLLSRVPAEKKIVVPYHSIGKKQGIMEAVELPEMIVYERGEKQGYKRVIAGICKEQIAKNGTYQVILHPNYCRGK